MHIRRSWLCLLFLLPALGIIADPFPPYWQGGAGAAVHYQPAPWPAEAAWIPYTHSQSNIEDARIQDPSNGGTAPQNYVNVSSSCTDTTEASIYWYYSPTGGDPANPGVLYVRWRTEQRAHTYATGPSAGTYSSSDPWNSAQWTVLFDLNGDGWRDFAAHLNGSSGSPAEPVDVITSVWSNTLSNSIDYVTNASIHELFHSPTAFVDQATGKILNFQNSLTPTTNWPNGASEILWDYGTTRAIDRQVGCTEYYIDYQIPLGMLDASGVGGPKMTADTPFTFTFATANSLNNPFQKDVVYAGDYICDASRLAPMGDAQTMGGGPFYQPIVLSISTQSCPINLTTQVMDALDVVNCEGVTTVTDVDFYYYLDANGNGQPDDGNAWTFAAQATASAVPTGQWTATWSSASLDQGSYLIGVQAEDAQGNRTFSYAAPGTLADPQFSNPAPDPGQLWASVFNSCGVPPPSLSKTVSDPSPNAGDTVSFTITVNNPSSSAITVSSITDILPSGFSYQGNLGGSLAASVTSAPAVNDTGTITFDFGAPPAIGASSSGTLSFDVTVSSSAGTYQNSATAVTSYGALEADPVTVDVGEPVLSISKSADAATAAPGDTITWTLTYANNSLSNASGVTIADTIPSGMTYVPASASDGGTEAGGTITWNLGSLGAGEGPFSVTFQTTVDDPYPDGSPLNFTNTATIDSNETAPADGVGSILVNAPRPAMLIQKDGPVLIAANGSATYTISYANTGTTAASSVTITDVIPSGFVYTSATPAPTTAPAAGTNGTVIWTIGSVAAGASGSVQLVLTHNEAGAGSTASRPTTNTATINWKSSATATTTNMASDSYETDISDATCSSPTTYYFKNSTADVGFAGTRRIFNTTAPVSPTATALTQPTVGSTAVEIARFYQSSPTGSTVAINGTITSNLYIDKSGSPQAELTLEAYDYDPITGATVLLGSGIVTGISGNKANELVSIPIMPTTTTIPAGHRVLFVLLGRTNHASQTNSLSLNFDGTSSPSRVSFCTAALRAVTDKQASSLSGGQGDTITYTVEFGNPSATNLTGATVVDTLPVGMTYVANSALLNGGAVVPVVSGQQLTFNVNTSDTGTVGQLTAGQSGTLTYQATIGSLDPSAVTLTNALSLDTNETSPETDSVDIGVVLPSLNLSKSVSSSLLEPGDTVNFTLTISNSGNAPATNVSITDTFPTEPWLTLGGMPSGCVAVGPTVTCTAASLAVGASTSFVIPMSVASSGVPSGATYKSNVATAAADELSSTVTSNTVDFAIIAAPILSITKASDAGGTLSPGDTITWTITVSNSGTATAADVKVIDTVPPSTRYVGGSVTGTGGAYSAATNAITWTIGALAPGASETLTFMTTIDDTLPSGTTTITNTALASSSNTAGKSSTVSVSATAAPILSIVKTGPTALSSPLATIDGAVTSSTVVTVDSTLYLGVNKVVIVNGTLATITAINGLDVTLDTAVTAADGADVRPALRYDIAYSNSGDADATGVTVVDTLPAGLAFIKASPVATSDPGVGNSGAVQWTIGNLGAGDVALLTLWADPTANGSYTNSATIDSNETGPVVDSVTSHVGVLEPTKSTSTSIVTNTPSGTSATYTVTIVNQSATTATGVVVTDSLAPGFTYAGNLTIGGTATQTLVNNPTVGDESASFGTFSIPGGGTLTLTFDVAIDATVAASTYQNEVSATSTNIDALFFDFLAVTAEDVTVLATPVATIGDAGTVLEGGVLTYTVSLSSASTQDTTLSLSYGGTATSGSDYTAGPSTVTILAGNTTASVVITTTDDNLSEPTETVTVSLSGVTTGTAAIGTPSTGTGSITDGDGVPTIAIDDVTVAEGDAGTTPATFTVNLSNPSTSTITVNFNTADGTATSGLDYTASSGTVTFAPGVTSQTITIDVLGDLIDETNETYTVNLTSPTNATIADGTGLGTITDNEGTPTISIDDVTVAEGDAGTTPALFTVSLSNVSASTITVDFSTANGSATSGLDYTASSGTVTFAPGVTIHTVTIDVLGDTIAEPTETYTVVLTNPTDATIADGTGLGTITDDDGVPTISINDVTVAEGDAGTTPATFTVSLSNPSTSTITVNFGTADGTASSGLDYTASTGTVTFAPGETSHTITIDVLGDLIDELDETFTVNLTSPSNATIADGTGLGTITDDDGAPTISIDDVTVSEGNSGTTPAIFTLTLSNPSVSTVTVDYVTSNGTAIAGSDYTSIAGTVTFAPGVTSQTITIDVLGDTIDEVTETFDVNLSNPSNATIADVTGLGTITDDDGAPSITIDDVTVIEGDTGTTAAIFTVTLSNPSATTVTVNYATAGGTASSGVDFQSGAGTVTFNPGITTQTVIIDVIGDLIDESNETFTVNLTNAVGSTIGDPTGIGTIVDDDGEPSVSIGDASVNEGGPLQFQITLSNPSATDITLTLDDAGVTATSGTDYTAGSYTVTFPAGSTVATLSIPTTEDATDESNETMTLAVIGSTGGVGDTSDTGTGTIIDDDGAPSVSIDDASVTEGGDLVFRISLSNPSATEITLTLDDAGVTATSGTDYTAGPYTITFPAGSTQGTLLVPTTVDVVDESNETFVLAVTGVTAGAVGDASDTGTGTIIDDDGAPSVTVGDATVTEGGLLIFDVELSNPSATTITLVLDDIGVTATSGTDYSAGTYTVTFSPGETVKTLSVPTTGDTVDESDETMEIAVVGVTAGSVSDATDRGTGTILDDDGAPSVLIGDATILEGGTLVFDVTLSNPSASTITLTLGDVEQTASTGTDYTSGPYTLTFNPGETTGTVNVATLDDAADESDETFLLVITGVTGSVGGTSDTGTGTIVDNDSTSVADLSIVKDDGGVERSPGDPLVYAIRVTNNGPDVAQQIVVTDTPGPGLDYVGFSGSGWSCADAGATVTCQLAFLGVTATSTVELTFDVDPGYGGSSVNNDVSVSASTSDPDPSDDTDSEPTPIVPAAPPTGADLAITKTISETDLLVGQTFDFILLVENVGPIDGTDVIVTDDLPVTFALQSVSSTIGTCSGTTSVTCLLGTMSPGESVTIRLTGTATAAGEILNEATVVANEIEAITANNASIASVQVAAAVAAIPTLGEWAMLMLMLGLALVGMRRL